MPRIVTNLQTDSLHPEDTPRDQHASTRYNTSPNLAGDDVTGSNDVTGDVIRPTDSRARCIRRMYTMGWIFHQSDAPYEDPVLNNFQAATFTAEMQIGRQLALLGDDVHDIYTNHHHHHMVYTLNVSRNTAYQTITNIVSRLICHSYPDWEHLVTLLYFSYRMAISDNQGLQDFLCSVINFVVQYVVADILVTWLGQQDQWISVMQCLSELITSPLGGAICTAIALLVSLILFLRYRHT